jgi:predicted transcriptional regulator of viral defense system
MQYLELKEHFKDFIVFSLNDIKKVEPSFHRQRLNEWQKKGYIKKIINECYIFSDTEIDESMLFILANTVYHSSYISFEMAFSYYSLIPEGVYTVTSATSRTTRKFSTQLATFTYRHIKPELLFGYTLVAYKNQTFKIAEIEKAILDYLYLNSSIKTPDDFKGLRFNTVSFHEQADMEKLKRYLDQFDSRALEKRVGAFLTFLNQS